MSYFESKKYNEFFRITHSNFANNSFGTNIAKIFYAFKIYCKTK